MPRNEDLHQVLCSLQPRPWVEGDNLPWNEADFSRRMLREHLAQGHDQASRRFETIDAQVEWMHQRLLDGEPTRVLDLGCGPGLYAQRLALLGHTVRGIDFGPASIEYAEAQAKKTGVDCEYVLSDLRDADFGAGYGFVLLIYGELNVFRPVDLRRILDKACAALAPGGTLLLEPHTAEFVERLGAKSELWYRSRGGVFGDEPHLVLMEHFWDEATRAATIRYFVITEDGAVTRYAQSFLALQTGALGAMLKERGLETFTVYDCLGGKPVTRTDELRGPLYALSAIKES
ncbi:MAG: methyltransferase domain-containing protein [Candidatus Coatesbacteria bacterium]|nr:methyltransferase domain-containing protein [Candidatus Coatesbacteria bacterium]